MFSSDHFCCYISDKHKSSSGYHIRRKKNLCCFVTYCLKMKYEAIGIFRGHAFGITHMLHTNGTLLHLVHWSVYKQKLFSISVHYVLKTKPNTESIKEI